MIGSVVISIAIALSGFHNRQYTYIDGSANSYEVTAESVHYVPIKPENSSSGSYDGGEEWARGIDHATFHKLEILFLEAIKDTSGHIENRIKGSGMIIYFDDDTEKSVVLASGSNSKDTLESALRQLEEQ